MRAINNKFSSTVNSSIIVSCCDRRPIYLPTIEKSILLRGWSSKEANPSVTGISIESIFRVELLPEPGGPSKPKISPCLTPKVFEQTASKPFSYTFFNFDPKIYHWPSLSSF
jgi:hypothetical protein